MNCTDALALMQGFVDGELEQGKADRLLAHTRGCDTCRRELALCRQLTKAAAAALSQEASAPAGLAQAVSARIAGAPALATLRPPRRRLKVRLAIAGAAAVLIAFALAQVRYREALPSWLAIGRPTRAPLVAVTAAMQPATDGGGGALEVGDRLPGGATVRTGDGGRVTLVTRHGSEYTLNENTVLRLNRGGTKAELRKGEVYCRSRGGEIQEIETAAGRIHLLGTALDAATQDGDAVAVTVVRGQVRLENAHGEAVIEAGHRALLVASLPPEAGSTTNTFEQTAWYSGRRDIFSDFGDIVYTVNREDAKHVVSEVWAMNADGTGKRYVKSYLAHLRQAGPWFPQDQWLLIHAGYLVHTRPDLERRRAHAGGGHPITWGPQVWFLNAATGQEVPLQMPPGYQLWQVSISPDARKAVFNGVYWPDFPEGPSEGGAWLYDVETAEITKLTDSTVNGLGSWSPDSRFLAMSLRDRKTYYGPLALMDTSDRHIEELQPQGFLSSFSPDGRYLAYSSDQERDPRRRTRAYRIFVLDLADPDSPVPVTPPCPEIGCPTWSPDGTRIAYRENHSTFTDDGIYLPAYALYVAEADGSGITKLSEAPERVVAVSWAPSGDAIYLSTNEGIHLIAADGSGLIADLGGTEHDSVLGPEQQAQMEAAVAALKEAVFQYAVGRMQDFEAKPAECKAAFGTAAEIFAAVPYDYPLAAFSLDQALIHADTAHERASRTDADVLADSCAERLRHLRTPIDHYVEERGELPPDLSALEEWFLDQRGRIGIISRTHEDWPLFFRCPVANQFVYDPPAEGDPEVGEAIVRCATHPDSELVWKECMARALTVAREKEAEKADPQQ